MEEAERAVVEAAVGLRRGKVAREAFDAAVGRLEALRAAMLVRSGTR